MTITCASRNGFKSLTACVRYCMLVPSLFTHASASWCQPCRWPPQLCSCSRLSFLSVGAWIQAALLLACEGCDASSFSSCVPRCEGFAVRMQCIGHATQDLLGLMQSRQRLSRCGCSSNPVTKGSADCCHRGAGQAPGLGSGIFSLFSTRQRLSVVYCMALALVETMRQHEEGHAHTLTVTCNQRDRQRVTLSRL
jgi:hypothetical protein